MLFTLMVGLDFLKNKNMYKHCQKFGKISKCKKTKIDIVKKIKVKSYKTLARMKDKKKNKKKHTK